MKDTIYFRHDFNAHQDPKIIKLRMRHGLAGYGFYWIAIETMRAQQTGKLSPDDICVIAFVSGISEDDANAMMDACIDVGLFKKDKTGYWSDRLLADIENMHSRRVKASESGRKGGRPKANEKQNESEPFSNEKQNESKTKANQKLNSIVEYSIEEDSIKKDSIEKKGKETIGEERSPDHMQAMANYAVCKQDWKASHTIDANLRKLAVAACNAGTCSRVWCVDPELKVHELQHTDDMYGNWKVIGFEGYLGSQT